MAVTAEGVPIRCWTFPGTTSDQLVIREVKDDLGSWMLNRVLWVTDSGFNSAANRACLQRGGEHYVVCEKLRSASADAKKALARPGRYHLVEGNLSVKEVRTGDGARAQRFVICVNPGARARDEIVRGNLVSYWADRIAGSDEWSTQRRDELVGELRATPGLARFLRRTKDHKLRVDKAAIERDAHFDGKWLIRTSTGLPPPRRPHPLPHPALLARAPPRPGRRERDRRHLAQRPSRARPHAPRHLGDQGGPHRQAVGDDEGPAEDPRRPQGARASPDPRLRTPDAGRVVAAHSPA